MRNIFYKAKTRVLAIGFISVVGVYFAGKKFIEYLNDYGEPEPLTDDEIKKTLGI